MRGGPSDVAEVLSELASHRPVFHSEADFQFALAWQWQQQAPEAKIRLEYPLPSGERRTYADLWIQEAGDHKLPRSEVLEARAARDLGR